MATTSCTSTPVGFQWDVPIFNITVDVDAPVGFEQTTCFAGSQGSLLGCDSHSSDGTSAAYTQEQLGSYQALTIVASLPEGSVDASPILDEVWSLARSFEPTPVTAPASGLVGLLGAAGVGTLLWRHGRDRRYAGGAVDAAFGPGSGEGVSEPVPLGEQQINPVEFVPPEGIRPGHLGTLWDEVANPLDVSAMIIDLAVRGFIRIEEVEAPSGGVFGFGKDHGDYRFVRLQDHRTYSGSPALMKAETQLLDALFADGESPLLSDLKTKFAARLKLVQGSLYDDAVASGWFRTRPDRVRARWRRIGLVLLLAGAGIVALMAWKTHLALIALPLPFVGVAILAFNDRFPHRTPAGTALLGRCRGFEELFRAGEGERQRFAEAKHLFGEYLPYAIVFGMAEQWAATFESLGATPEELGVGAWYVSPYGYRPLAFGHAMSSFSTVTSGAIAAAAPSSASSGGSGFSGGGFSGGGIGGGGGGSW